tara:strand:- start:2337 stop:2555 length:219 start_codon:yes stop_codon:yes gene_type:complete
MDYQVPDLCVMTITPDEETGKVWLDMPSVWDPSPQPPVLVTQKTIDFVMKDRFTVPMCPPGWPNPPTVDEDN